MNFHMTLMSDVINLDQVKAFRPIDGGGGYVFFSDVNLPGENHPDAIFLGATDYNELVDMLTGSFEA